MKGICWICILVLIIGCSKAELEQVDNLNENRVWVIGHGGTGFASAENYIPINSFTSVTKAVEGYSADGVEVDVQMSADGTLFMYHDDQLQSMTNCTGCIWKQNARDLEPCRYREGIGANVFMEEQLIPLEVVVKRFAQRATKPIMILDTKTINPCLLDGEQMAAKALLAASFNDLFNRYDGADWLILDTDDLDFIKSMQILNPSIKAIWLAQLTAENIQIATENELYGISFQNEATSKEFIEKAHDAGLVVSLYGVKIRSAAVEAVNKHPDFIEVDNIPLLQEILRQ